MEDPAGDWPSRSRVACLRQPVQAQQEVSPVAKLSFLAGFGAGYVLGSRAGRERYEQIRRAWAMPATLCRRGSSLACDHARRICS